MEALFNGKEIWAKDKSSWVKISIRATKPEWKERNMATIYLWILFLDQACPSGGK